MKLDVPTLTFVLGLSIITLLVALSVQYWVTRAYRGVGWWLMGSLLMALGFLFLGLGHSERFWPLAALANPLLVSGRMCILVGVAAFLDRKASFPWLGAVLLAFLGTYYLYLFAIPSLPARTVVVSAAIALISFMTAYLLLTEKRSEIRGSVRFTASVFVAHGAFLLLNILATLRSPHIDSYTQYSAIQRAAFVVPIVTSTLWTFGLILMVNQRLNAENITEKLKLQEALDALMDSEETYRSILHASPDDITITDLEGRILIVSPAASVMFGYEPGEATGLSVMAFLAPEDHAQAQSHLRLLTQGEVDGPREFRGLRKDRSTFDIEINSGIIRGSHGHPAKLVFVVRDISGRKKVELEKAELEIRNRQLQKAESLGRMAGAIAHTFNNKLQMVMTNLELVGCLPEGGEPGVYLARAQQATEEASEVSRLMLAYLGQASHGQVLLDLSEWCRENLPLLQGTLPAQVSLVADLPSSGPVIRGNGAQLQQILVNLVTNAWEAMGGRAGAIQVALYTCSSSAIPALHRVPVNWEPKAEDYACLEVSDSGSGIAEEDLEKLFDPFFSTRFTGRGMGLPVVLGFVQAHGGSISVESRPGHGCVFRVYFPVSSENPLQSMKTGPSSLASHASGTVLLVDDEPMLLDSARGLLEVMGFRVLVARDGMEALEVFRDYRKEIRCVITDLTMPRLDGWGTLLALRELDPVLPVILVSGYARVQVMAGEHAQQPQAFLSKPFSFKQLQEAVALALGTSR